MGNGIGKLKLCFTGDVGEISKKHNDITVQVSDHLEYDDYSSGDSYCHTSEEPLFTEDYTSTIISTKTSYSGAFLSVSDSSIPAYIFPPFSNPGLDFYPSSDRSSAFENSTLLSWNYIDSVLSGLSSRVSGSGSGPIERGFVSGPIGRSLTSLSLADDDEGNGQQAQGKAGEDRVHLAVSEEHGWVFVGIYDGFNGPDAADFLVNNLYSNVFKELKELLWNDKLETSDNSLVHQNQELDEKLNNLGANGGVGVGHFDVLKALSEALRKTEASYLEMANMRMKENPELALMGSCVLVMLLNGKDVYLMNVGDSRAILAQNPESHPSIGMLDQINEECLNGIYRVESKFTSCQLTMDHSTSVKEEVLRIRSEHPDDVSVIKNDRVKDSLKVTRAFGAGYLKEPKWNNALLEAFRIDYIGNSPYINCLPSLYHHTLGPSDRFMILSSDGLYQYFTNEESVSEVENFMSKFPEGDPSQHLGEEMLFRAARKAGMDFDELLDLPPGDRRRYHDDVSIIIISFEGKTWRSSV